MHLKSAVVKLETNESDGYAQSPLYADECIQRASAALVNAAVRTHLCLQKHLTDACSSSSASRYARCRVRCGLFCGQALRSVNFFLCAAQRVKSAATRASGHSAFLRKVRSGKRPSEGWEVVMSWKSADTFHMKNVGRIWIWAPPLSALSLDTFRQVCLSGR